MLKGMRQRHEKTNDTPILIHTVSELSQFSEGYLIRPVQSGMGVLTHGQQTYGMAQSDVIHDDSDFEQVANIDLAAMHRSVDNVIFEADAEGTRFVSGHHS